MRIKKIRIRNFGQFHNREFTFAPGLNVIYGENESGKTTLHTFLVSMLFGLEKSRGRGAKQDVYTKYEPWNSASFYSGEMEFEVGGKDFGLERNFYHREKQTTLISRQDGELLSEEYGDLQMLLGGLNKEMYENTYCIPQAGAAPGKELAEFVQNCMANAAGTGDGTLQLNLALAQIHKKRKQAAAQVKQETELRQHRMEKLQIEREILEEDIAQLQGKDIKEAETAGDGSEKHQKRNGMPAHLLVLILGCFFMAACFLGAAVFHIPWNSILMESIVIGGVTLVLSLVLYGMEKRHIPEQTAEKPKKGRLSEERREKQTRLFNILESQTELEMPTERENERKQYLSACDIAEKTIRALTGEIYEDFGDRINSRTSEILSHITQGQYDRVGINEKMEVSVYAGTHVCSPKQLSTGTLEQIYFALRISLGEILTDEEPMPFLLDETFARYDETRIRNTLQWIGTQGRQMILFTCHKREMEYLDEMGIAYHKIELEGQ